jgi:magnesium transporter
MSDEQAAITIFAVRGSGPAQTVPVEQLRGLLADPEAQVWVDLGGPMNETALEIVRDVFHFHPLAVEDCFGSRAQPKVDEYEGYVYLITHGLSASSLPEEPNTIELDAFVGARYLVTYHRQHSRSIAAIQESVRGGPDLLRRGPGALLHAILAHQVQGIGPVIDALDDRIGELEDRAVTRPRRGDLAMLLALRRSVLHLRRWLTRQRDVVGRLGRGELRVGGPHEALHFRDVYDDLQRFTDLLENYRELITSIQEASLTVTNNRLNEIMKFLTIFTATLMPLTVITGIYGMNFAHMPELRWRWGYPVVLVVMLVTALGVLGYFHRRGWLGREPGAGDDVPPPAPVRDKLQPP